MRRKPEVSYDPIVEMKMDVRTSSYNIALSINRMAQENRLAPVPAAKECMDRAQAILHADLALRELCTQELADACLLSMAQNAFEIGQIVQEMAASGNAILGYNEPDMFAPWVAIPMASTFTLVALPAYA